MQFAKSSSVTERPRPAQPVLEFPGCRTIASRCCETVTCDGRLGFWGADTEAALVIHGPASFAHGDPSQRLAWPAQLIPAARRSPIKCCGAMDLALRNQQGERWRRVSSLVVDVAGPHSAQGTGRR